MSTTTNPSNTPTRRTVLRGAGAALSLPWLEAMADTSRATKAAGAARPVRTAYVFFPNGTNYDHFAPSGTGRNWQTSPTLEPLQSVRQHLNILTGLTADKARANGDGPGDHARSAAAFLTGSQPSKTAGRDVRAGVSIDQVAASRIGADTRLPSLELGCDRVRNAGNCDSGYACAYQHNVSWASPTRPMPQLIDPALAFDHLFGHAGDLEDRRATQRRWARRASVLDTVADESARLQRALGTDDRRKLDEYQASVREIERRIHAAQADSHNPDQPDPGIARPQGIPAAYSEHIQLMFDLMALAFETDQTRIATFMLAKEGSNRSFPEIGVRDGHHSLSHHQGNRDKIEQIRRIDRFYMQQFARFVQKLADTRDGDGSLLDHSQILFGSGISDGNRHNHHDLPIIYAGGANGRVPTGRLVQYDRDTPVCNLYLTMLDHAGVTDVETFGDATGRLSLA